MASFAMICTVVVNESYSTTHAWAAWAGASGAIFEVGISPREKAAWRSRTKMLGST
ncbi:hypothetical protein SNOG_15390 [Parastagonospora nodorum SN15]|uniref:Uncharacterized protein n=1 Tax=Phaeosphaeria nodorum (strain SN15 / ATCC MYA-4574 / FGSC 10173) TaxID=321614 RepID=Q0TYW8_PHANO|nr:hypothetical protein SNOG_15390 [Parastagonospora nodorum SN15]EAT77323.1 hypothetical protein SNOG_15390 [Parastagonospora nodorum SN15]